MAGSQSRPKGIKLSLLMGCFKTGLSILAGIDREVKSATPIPGITESDSVYSTDNIPATFIVLVCPNL
jgi:hypothetical protein